jgi:hypothetical protein
MDPPRRWRPAQADSPPQAIVIQDQFAALLKKLLAQK